MSTSRLLVELPLQPHLNVLRRALDVVPDEKPVVILHGPTDGLQRDGHEDPHEATVDVSISISSPIIHLTHQVPEPPHLAEGLAGYNANAPLLVRLGVAGGGLPGGRGAGGAERLAGQDVAEGFRFHVSSRRLAWSPSCPRARLQ